MLPILVSSAQRFPWPSCSIPNLKRRHRFIRRESWSARTLETEKSNLFFPKVNPTRPEDQYSLHSAFPVLITTCKIHCLTKEHFNKCTFETTDDSAVVQADIALLPEPQLPQQLEQLLWWCHCTRLPNVDSNEASSQRGSRKSDHSEQYVLSQKA